MSPTEEEFDAWRDNPVTQWVMTACRRAAAECRETWQASAWETGEPNEALLKEMRTRADAYVGLVDTDYQGWVDWND